jgi:hypothetical protein
MLQNFPKQFQGSPFGVGGSTQHGCNMEATSRPDSRWIYDGLPYEIIRRKMRMTPMAKLEQQIAEKFLAKLAAREGFDAEKVDQLRRLLAENKKPKADDLVQVFSLPAGSDVA